MEFNHISVLLNECIESLNIKSDGIYIDGTAGGAGHSKEIAKRLDSGLLLALDQDPDAVEVAIERLKNLPAKVIRANFSQMDIVALNEGIEKVDGILLDLGVSSHQLDTAERGFSYHKDAPLDMRMSQKGISAKDIVNNFSEKELSDILIRFGEEKFSRRIATKIVEARKEKEISTTLELAEIIANAVPARERRDGHPARKSFQALRIAVNAELDVLNEVLDKAFDLLKPDGVLAIITFHSLEDRIVKLKYKEFTTGCTCPPDFPVCVCGKTPRGRLLTKKPIEPSQNELEINPRSRSAKLRVIIKN